MTFTRKIKHYTGAAHFSFSVFLVILLTAVGCFATFGGTNWFEKRFFLLKTLNMGAAHARTAKASNALRLLASLLLSWY